MNHELRKLRLIWTGLALAGVLMLCGSFRYDSGNYYYGGYVPYFMERSELERSVFYDDGPRDMAEPGKIYLHGERIYVVERYKGIHVIDNSNPYRPSAVEYIVAPGCMDVAIKDGILYLDNAVDLVAFDLATGRVTQRLVNYFPEPISPAGEYFYGNRDDKILVGWKQED